MGVEPVRDAERVVEVLPAFLRALLAGLGDADAFELDRRLRRAVELEQRLEAQLGPALLDLAEGRLHRGLGFRSLDAYANERLDMSPRKLRSLLRLERAGRRRPALARAFHSGRLSWVRTHALVPVMLLSSTWQEEWVDRAERVSVRRLEEDVEQALVLHAERPDRFAETGGLPTEGAERQTGAQPRDSERNPDPPERAEETARFFFGAPREVAHFLRAVVATVRRRLERERGRLPTEGEAVEAMFAHAFHTWAGQNATVARAHAVYARDDWRCTVPGCSSYRNLHRHHIQFRSRGGSDDDANCTTVCAWHHQRGIHGPGVVSCRGTAPDGLRFELGVRGSAPPLVAYRSGDLLAGEVSRVGSAWAIREDMKPPRPRPSPSA